MSSGTVERADTDHRSNDNHGFNVQLLSLQNARNNDSFSTRINSHDYEVSTRGQLKLLGGLLITSIRLNGVPTLARKWVDDEGEGKGVS